MSEQKNRIIYLDYLKIFAMIAVVLLHVAAGKWYSVKPITYEWQILNAYDSLARWAVPIFVMVSGALFLDSDKTIDLKKLYKKNIFRLVTSFAFWTLIYATITYLRNKDIKGAIFAIIKGNYHMWFLFMIVGLYILIPLLKKIVESKSLTEYFLILVVVFTFLIPRGLKIFSLLEIPHTKDLANVLQSSYNQMHFHFTLGFVGYFVAGAYFRNYEISKKREIFIYILGLIGFLSTIGLTSWYSLRQGQQTTLFYSELSIPVMLETLSVFTLAKCRLSKIKITEKGEKLVGNLAK